MPLDDNVLIACLSKRVRAGTTTNHGLDLRFGDCRLRVRVNSQELAKRLCQYFAPFLDAGLNDHPDLVIDALEMPEPDLGIDFMAWPRDPGKPGRKDSFIDLADGRACRKVKTTLQYLMSENERLIFGPCL
ncbi:MAG TPA: HprK-related kinase B, partial [Rhodospirillales bacterium]|nr:HprK-related kinase B [Rhodospirillales bacterium]